MNKTLKNIDAAIDFNKLVAFLLKTPLVRRKVPPYIYGDYHLKKRLDRLVKVMSFLKTALGKALYLAFVYFMSIVIVSQVPNFLAVKVSFKHEGFYLFWFVFLMIGSYKDAISHVDQDSKIKLMAFKVPYKAYYGHKVRELSIDRLIYSFVLLAMLVLLKTPVIIIGWFLLMVILMRIYAELSKVNSILKYGFKAKLPGVLLFVKVLVIPGTFLLWYLTSIKLLMLSGFLLLSLYNFYLYIKLKKVSYLSLLETSTRYFIHEHDQVLLFVENMGMQGLEMDDLDHTNYDVSALSAKRGYSLFNKLFISRHKSLWFKPLRNTSLIFGLPMLLLTLAYMIASLLGFTQGQDLSQVTMILPTIITFYLMGMYFSNLGEKLTKAYYLHGDYSLLHYAFYKRKENIWKQYLSRLRTGLIFNFIPTLIIIFFMILWRFLLPSAFSFEDVSRTIVSLILITSFFSIHTLSLYYLLQPFNKKLEAKSVLYSILNVGVYIFVFNSNELFSSSQGVTLVGAVVMMYFLVSVILVRLFSHKTFTWKD